MSRTGHPLTWTFSHGHRAGKKMIEVDDEYGCWIWQGHIHGGYGVMTYSTKQYPNITVGRRASTIQGNAKKKSKIWQAIMPHQFFYCITFGNPPEGTQLAHTCHRRSCCRPDHVRPKTPIENNDERFMLPSWLDSDTKQSIEDELRCDLPVNQVAFNHAVPMYTVIKILNALRTEQSDLPFEDPVPF